MAFSPSYDSKGIEHFEISNFQFTNGTTIPIRVAYRSFNSKSPKKALVPTCYGGIINETCAFNSPGQALTEYHVVVVAMLGNGESTSPSSTPSFPKRLYYQDCVNAQYRLLTEHLKISELDVVVGFSMGGQQAYYWAAMYPSFLRHSVPICSSARTSGHNYTFLEGPKAALINSADYAEFHANGKKAEKRPVNGLKAFGRAYTAWLTSGAWYQQRLWETLGFKTIEDYVSGELEADIQHWDPEDLLILAWMWQHGDIGTTLRSSTESIPEDPNPNLREFRDGERDAYENVLEKQIQARVLVMPCRTDQYFAWEDSELEVTLMGEKSQLAVIESVWGHAAGGGACKEDTEWISQRIAKFLQEA